MNVVADLVRDNRINIQYSLQGLMTYGEIDRVFVVKDIGTAGGESAVNEVEKHSDCRGDHDVDQSSDFTYTSSS